MQTPRIDLCKLMDTNDFSNIILDTLFRVINDSSPGFAHKCPYKEVNVTKSQIKAINFPQVFPSGDYRMFNHFETFNDEWYLTYSFDATVKSSEKNVFG